MSNDAKVGDRSVDTVASASANVSSLDRTTRVIAEMRGLGAFQMAQMKHRDARVSAMCKHLRDAITLWEEIQLYPFEKPEPEVRPESPPASPPLIPVVPSEKLTYSVKEAATALGIGRGTVWAAIGDNRLNAVKLGRRTLIPADALRGWIAGLPAKKK